MHPHITSPRHCFHRLRRQPVRQPRTLLSSLPTPSNGFSLHLQTTNIWVCFYSNTRAIWQNEIHFSQVSLQGRAMKQLVVTAWWQSRRGAEGAGAVARQPEPPPWLCNLHEPGTGEKCNERQCREARGSAVLSVKCSPLHNHTCPTCSHFPMDLIGFWSRFTVENGIVSSQPGL